MDLSDGNGVVLPGDETPPAEGAPPREELETPGETAAGEHAGAFDDDGAPPPHEEEDAAAGPVSGPDLPLQNKIEAILFVTPDPISAKRLANMVGEVTTGEVRDALATLAADYAGRGIELVEIAGGFRFFSREEYSPWTKKVIPEPGPTRLSRAALETLSIIAYRQPVTRVTVEEIRGCNCDGVVRTLLERKLINSDGQAEMPGRPFLYRTTKHFLEYFGLAGLSELPPLKDAVTETREP